MGKKTPREPAPIDPQVLAKYQVKYEDLQPIVRKRELSAFTEKFQSVDNLIKLVNTNPVKGLAQSEQEERKQVFGCNKIEPPPPTPFWKLMLDALNDTTMIILLVSAIVSLILTTTVISPDKLEWIDSVAILIAVFVVVMVTACNDYSKEKQFRKLNAQKDDKTIKVIRDGGQKEISIHDIVVGDIVVLAVGDQIPGDGVLITANDVKVDESGMTGESDEIKKSLDKDPFMIGSCLIRHGSGTMVVTAVGVNSIYGDILKTLQENDEETPLQGKLDELAKIIGYCGIGAAVLTFLALIIRFFIDGKHNDGKNFVQWVNYFILAITIIVVAVPEGLPLAVTISLAYSMKQMIKDQCLVRKLESCETMGSASNICTDKTGTLTLNQMRVVKARFGSTIYQPQDGKSLGAVVADAVNPDVARYFNTIQAICSTAELRKDEKGVESVVGNKTEGALLFMGQEIGFDYVRARQALVVGEQLDGALRQRIDFSSDRKRMTAVLDVAAYVANWPEAGLTGEILVLSKGASEIMLDRCTTYLDEQGAVKPLTDEVRQTLSADILEFAKASLRTLVLAYKHAKSGDSMEPDDLESELTLVCLVGIQDPLRPAVKGAIRDCKRASITVRMVTGDNIVTAVAISKDAGIIPPDVELQDALDRGMAITGPDFAALSDEQVDALIPTLVCMARSAPTDKYRLVCRLKANNYVVAATGDGSNDAPQLKAANVGLAMGIAGTEVAKEASDMIIMNDAFDSIVKAVAWGRTVTANVRKFLQFQLTVNVVALIIAFLGAAVLEESALTSIQLLYVNLIMDSLGSLALATESPSPNILNVPPVHRSASLITPGMLRNIILIAAFQIIIILIMMFETPGNAVTQVPENLFPGILDSFGLNLEQRGIIEQDLKGLRQKYRYTVIYNFFIFVQIFNEFNSRRIANELNIFQNIFKGPMFLCVIIGTTVVQIIIMLVPGIRDVFNIYTCTPGRLKPCFQYEGSDNALLEGIAAGLIGVIPQNITGISWAVSVLVALGCMIIHFFGRLVKTAPEFKVSEARIKKDLEKIRKRAEKKAKDEEKEQAKIKARYQAIEEGKPLDDSKKKEKGKKKSKNNDKGENKAKSAESEIVEKAERV